MRLTIKRWIISPIFEHDEIKTYRARLLNAILIGILGLALVSLVGSWLGGRTPTATVMLDVLVVVSCAGLWYWMRRGQIVLASIALLAAGAISITAAVATLGTIRAPATALFLLLVIVGGLLFDLPGILVTTGLSSLAVLGLILAENAGWLPPVDQSVTITQWAIYTGLFGVCGGLTYYSIQSTRDALKRADRELAERERTEEQIRNLNRDLERRASELQVANRELESFSYSISHDLRAPLASIGAFASRLLEDYDQLPPDARRMAELIQGNSAAMTQLVEGLLEFSRFIRQPLHRQKVDVNELVHRVMEDLHAQEEGRKIEFRIGDLPPCHADPILLKQVWMNLISNALKFTRAREVAQIEIGAKTAEEGAPLYFIRDNGVGFDPKQSERLFGVFHRLHSEDEYEGTGVGLAIVERIIRRHGGQVRAEGEVDRGATFYFSLST
jgi:signal transduction histidine kinase